MLPPLAALLIARVGTAAVLEGIRRCGELGATVAYVGSEQSFYLDMGFRKLYNIYQWMKVLTKL